MGEALRHTLLADGRPVGVVDLAFRSEGPAGAALLVATGDLEPLPAFAEFRPRLEPPPAPRPFRETGRPSRRPPQARVAYTLLDAAGAPVPARVYCTTTPRSSSGYSVLAVLPDAGAGVPAPLAPPPRRTQAHEPPSEPPDV